MSRPRVIQLDPRDPVGVALDAVAAGDAVRPGLAARCAIPAGHKVALSDIPAGAAVCKLGAPIGEAAAAIRAGEHVHTHNLRFAPTLARGGGAPATGPALAPRGATFEGYIRADGAVGTRNYLAVMATVNCSATVARLIADRFNARADLAGLESFDGAIALTHQHGCSVRADGPGMTMLRRTLAGYARHPNIAGVLVVGLGCEDNDVAAFLDASGLAPSERIRPLVIQEAGGTAATLAAGLAALDAMLPGALAARRSTVPASCLTVGLQCGGSDGFSALSANPALGRAVDRLVADGGRAILSETPELCGAEQLLLARAATPEVAARLEALLAWWEAQAKADGGDLDNNPSAGNKAGGVTTILEKSLGAVAKGGSSPLNGVYGYAERPEAAGLVFMDSPGYDPVSATGQVAASANLICFTSGRGSCYGCKPTPSLKLATNTAVFERMRGDFDINCGGVIDGTATLDGLGETIFEAMLATASGAPTASEQLGYGAEEFIPWTPGLTY